MKELHILDASASIIRLMKSMKMNFARHVACMGKMEICTESWSENVK
jgi:hypothetical protein